MGNLLNPKVLVDALGLTDMSQEAARKAVKMNKLAWAYLTMNLITEASMALINSTKDTDWPTDSLKLS